MNSIMAQENSDFYRQKGIVQYENEMYNFALESFTKAVRLNKEDYVSYNYLAKLALLRQERALALEFFKTSLEINENQDDILFITGELQDYYGNYNKALEFFTSALEINPENIMALIGSARIYSIKKNHQKSSEMFQKAFDLRIDKSAPFYNSGIEHMRKNNSENTISSLTECIKINPAHADAYFELAQYYRHLNRINDALKLLEKIKYLQPHLEKPYVQIAHIYFTVKFSKNYRQQILIAESNIKKAIEINDKNADYWEFLSEIYTSMDMYEESKTAGDIAFSLNKSKK